MKVWTMMMIWIIFLCSLFIEQRAASCPEKHRAWHPLPFSDLFRRREMKGLIQGRVIRTFPPQHVPHYGNEAVTAEIEIECVYHGSPILQMRRVINMTGFGHSHDCVNTIVMPDRVYLIFVEPYNRVPNIQYAVQEINLQRGAFTASRVKVATVTSMYVCRRPATGATTTLPPWRSLTPVKQIPWVMLPRGVPPQPPMGNQQVHAGAQQIRPCVFAVNLAFMMILMLK